MHIGDFDFELPDELIAQEPCKERDRSRLMVLDRGSGGIEHRLFFEITEYLRPGDLLVINDTKVIPARLVGRKETGGRAEIFLLERSPGKDEVWECLVGGKRVRAGLIIEFSDDLKSEVLEGLGDGRFKVLFHSDKPIEEVLEKAGQVPLPPYIKREIQGSRGQGVKNSNWNPRTLEPSNPDKDRYQTVFADKKGAVAAPTAGLHFTDALLNKIKDMGVEVATVTLHVGPGTFLPVRVEEIEEHRMHPERYEITDAAAEKINRAKREKRRVIAVGSTSLRTLESASTPLSSPLSKGGLWGVNPGSGRTSIFIYPGYAFKVADALVTNFHLPKSTLMMLVSAFAGREFTMKAYREAIDKKYRFYSYGDAMLIL